MRMKKTARATLTEEGSSLVKKLNRFFDKYDWFSVQENVADGIRRGKFEWAKPMVHTYDRDEFMEMVEEWMPERRRKEFLKKWNSETPEEALRAMQKEFDKEKDKALKEAYVAKQSAEKAGVPRSEINMGLYKNQRGVDTVVFTISTTKQLIRFSSEKTALQPLRMHRDYGEDEESKKASSKVAGGVKRWLEDVSVEMGLDGEITEEVMREGEIRMLVDTLKRMRGVSKIKREKWESDYIKDMDMTVTVDGEPVVLSVEKNGKVYWWDFSHKTYLGKSDRPREVVKGLQKAFKEFEEGLIASDVLKVARELVSSEAPEISSLKQNDIIYLKGVRNPLTFHKAGMMGSAMVVENGRAKKMDGLTYEMNVIKVERNGKVLWKGRPKLSSVTAALVPDDWMDVLMDGAIIFNREAKKRGYIIEKPAKFIGGVRFVLDSAGGKDGVQATISLFKPVNKPWFVRMMGWDGGEMFRNIEVRGGEELPSALDVAKLIGKAGDKVGFWGRR